MTTFVSKAFDGACDDFYSEGRYEGCTFDGVTIDDRFDECVFVDCQFTDCYFDAASIDLSFSVLTDCTIESNLFETCRFTDITFVRAEFESVTVTDIEACTFVDCDLSDLSLDLLRDCTLQDCELGTFSHVEANGCIFNNCTADLLRFDSLDDCEIIHCEWPGLLSVSSTRKSTFVDSNLTNARFRGGSINDVSFTRCDLAISEFAPEILDLVSILNCNTQKCSFSEGTFSDLRIETESNDEFLNPLFNSKEMIFSRASLNSFRFIDIDMQLSTFSACELEDGLCLDSNLSGTGLTTCLGRLDLEDCGTIGLWTDDATVEELALTGW